MDNKNSGNGPFDFFGLGPADGVSFEPSRPKEQSKPKSFDLGPINSPSATNNPPAPAKKKFEVHFDDSDMIAPVESVTSSQTSGIYFTPRKKKPEETAQKKSVKKKPHKKGTGFGKNFKSLSSNKALIAFCSAVVLCAVIVSCVAISCINDVFALNRSDESVSITIPNNADADQIIDILSDNGLVKQKLFCKFFYNLTQSIFNDEDDEPPVFLSGVYYVPSNLGLEGYIHEFQQIQVAADTVNVVFPEGWTIYQMFDKIENFGICSKDQLIAALEGADFDYSFIKNIPVNTNRVFALEGYFFPDTYEFYETMDANAVIRKFLNGFNNRWSEEYTARANELGMTMDEVLILASIIQREAADEEQMPLVSSVLHNRLDYSVSYPTLGCDATNNYIKTYVAPNVSANEANIYSIAYDTHSIIGLPAGPICNPGVAAIEAALYPEDTDYFYFCHDNSGEIYLARTNAEHDANTLKVLRANN